MQAAAHAGAGVAMCATGGTSRAGTADAPGLSGGPAGERTGRAGTEDDRTPPARRAAAADEDAGRVRLQPIAEGVPFGDPGTGEWGLPGRAEPVIFLGEPGTGKTHLLTGLCVAACRQKRRVRFITAAGLVNELVEAKHQLQLRRVLARWLRYELIAVDEVGYVPMSDVGAEFLFQVVAERAEKAAVIMTTNLPFSEWTQVIPNSRLCKALLDRVTDRAHIIETGSESYRFRWTLEKRKKKG